MTTYNEVVAAYRQAVVSGSEPDLTTVPLDRFDTTKDAMAWIAWMEAGGPLTEKR